MEINVNELKEKNYKYIRFDYEMKNFITSIMFSEFDFITKQNILVTYFLFEYTYEEIMYNFRNYLMSYDSLATQSDILAYEKSKEHSKKEKSNYVHKHEYNEIILNAYDRLKFASESRIVDFDIRTASFVIYNYFNNLSEISSTRYKNFEKKHKILFFGIKLEDIKGDTIAIKKARLKDGQFIKRKLNSLQRKIFEFNKIKTGEVGIKTAYASDFSVKRKLKSEEYEKMYFKNKQLYNVDTGEFFPLSDILEKKNEKKAAELLTLSKGLEVLAEEEKYVWRFITLTCPPEFHRIKTLPNKVVLNKEYQYLDPSKSAAFLQENWSKIRKQCYNRNIKNFGMYCSEPHKDGTLHRHYMVYASENHFLPKFELDKLSALQEKRKSKNNDKNFLEFVKYLTLTYPDTFEVQVLKYFSFSLKAVKIEYPKKVYSEFKKGMYEAKPTTYILKYILKSLGLGDFKGNEIENADSIRTTASIFRYRRYDYFGLKSVLGLYRMFCKIKDKKSFDITKIECEFTRKAFLSVNYFDKEKNKLNSNFAEFYKNIINAKVYKEMESSVNKYGEEVHVFKSLNTLINDDMNSIKLFEKQNFEITELFEDFS